MLRKITLATIILVTTSSLSYADTMNRPQRKMGYKGERMNNFAVPAPVVAPYAHFSVGGGPYVGFSLGARTNYSSDPTAYKGVEGTLFAGFGFLLSSGFYFAEEVLLANGVSIQNYSNHDTGVGAKSSWSAGFSVLPGYLILDNVLAYARLGVAKTKFTSLAGSSNGGQIGLGFQAAIVENWDLRGEYVYSFYQGAENCSTGQLSSPKSDQFNLGAVYKFM